MNTAWVIVTVVLALGAAASGVGTLTRQPQIVDIITAVGFPADRIWILGALKVAGAVGLLVGLAWWPLGVAAAVGLVAYFCGALAMHLRARRFDIAPATGFLVLSVVVLVLFLAVGP
ncbi:DoxX family protein [Nocardia puris]|uniref:DoxX-like protein n=1 Tax=Nocardia puris TaxID=208602 RepID=A0A366DWF2_9NOCA|nr:DoxX family protein [Nocardia puris]MBF6209846.1 DoxX family protein [Nocardia puris]MBF6366418.1 DoxX family protein [Nocardia puris]MBF6458243.1 DoxX family protein [Nocardia puris]RBO94417.1 DoxX-like protein [Nocardia puris]